MRSFNRTSWPVSQFPSQNGTRVKYMRAHTYTHTHTLGHWDTGVYVLRAHGVTVTQFVSQCPSKNGFSAM